MNLSGEDIQGPAAQDVGQKIWPDCPANLPKTYQIKHLCSRVSGKTGSLGALADFTATGTRFLPLSIWRKGWVLAVTIKH